MPRSTPSQALLAQPDEVQISRIVFSIVSKARENDSLGSLTPRLIRSEVENELGVPSGTLDASTYKGLVKRTIHDAMHREETLGSIQPRDNKTSKSGSKPKVGKSARTSVSKSIKSKKTIADSELEDEPMPSTSQRKANLDPSADTDEESGLVRSKSKAKSSATRKHTSPATKMAHSGPKRRRDSTPLINQGDSDAEISDTTPRITSSSHRVADKKSDSEMSSLVDEPPKKKGRGKSKIQTPEAAKPEAKSKRSKQPSQPLSKDEETIKRLKSLVVACGVRKQWARELNGLNTSAQVAHIRKILSDLGMVGRMSMEQAREIRARRELAQELDDVQKFERAIVSGKPFKTEGVRRGVPKGDTDDANDASDSGSDSTSAREPPKVNNARRSIMAFLQDQSSDDD
ncbi:hypothetical protein BJV78DRAFT_1285976 [Lactifluus subvellereus]|nr:hypothetical protein BJV78DRAFT_1285976 [Lactifluus subvellereus]